MQLEGEEGLLGGGRGSLLGFFGGGGSSGGSGSKATDGEIGDVELGLEDCLVSICVRCGIRRPPSSLRCLVRPESLKQRAAIRTLRLETRSAVSSNVSLLICSTISAILGFAGASAAASVELYRLDVAPRRRVCVGARRALAERN